MYGNVNLCMKVLHVLPIIPVYLIVFIVVYAFNTEVVYDKRGVTFWKVIVVPLFEMFAFMTVACHLRAWFIDPGKIDEDRVIREGEYQPDKAEFFCKKCSIKRPERAHHCKTCKRCVLKMDHHCPWIANCVGYNNQKYFFQFVFFATIGNFIAFCCLFLKLIHADFQVKTEKTTVNSVWKIIEVMWSPLTILMGTVLSLAMTLSIGTLLYYQSYLILNNITTVEKAIYSAPSDSAYYSEDKLHNFKTVLGIETYWEWVVPIFKPNKYNNGYSLRSTKRDR